MLDSRPILCVAVALTAALAFAAATGTQQRAAARSPDQDAHGRNFTTHLVRRPQWSVGTLGNGAGYILQALALGEHAIGAVALHLVPYGGHLRFDCLSLYAGSREEPVTLFGAARSAYGWANIQPVFEWLASSFLQCTVYQNEVIAAGASGDLAYVVASSARPRRSTRRRRSPTHCESP